MRSYMTVVASAVMQERYLASLADRTELLQDAMHRSQRYVRLSFPNRDINVLGAWMVLRCQEGAYDLEPLRGNGHPALVAALDELRYSPRRVARQPPRIQQPELFHHRPPTMTPSDGLKPTASAGRGRTAHKTDDPQP